MADLKKEGIIFDIQSLSFHDGPGTRTLVFLKGCPLKCLWCANPEGQRREPEIRHYSTKCKGCSECEKACNNQALTFENTGISIDKSKCSECKERSCVEACYNEALTVVGKLVTIKDVMKAVKRDIPYYRGEGGVTLSGGDPTYQPEFAIGILKACKEEYINTAIESAMFTNTEIVKKFIPYTDLFLTDIKHMDSNKHRELTGVTNEIILENIKIIAQHRPVIVRIPIISGFNDDDENMLETARFCFKNNINRINILPYHKLGQAKYNQLGLEYKMPEISAPENREMEHIKQLIESVGVTCVI